MAKKSQKEKLTDDVIIGMYMDYVLEHETVPKSIYKFCKSNEIKEEEFYKFFGSIETIQTAIWEKFYTNTHSLIVTSDDYDSYSNKDKMLTFYFSMFELLTMNRSYVLFTLKEHKNLLKNLSQLKGLRGHIKTFATELINDGNSDKNFKLTKKNPKVFSEGAWFQFLFLLKFWMDDSSPAFEKTDVAIEKSVNTVFDVFENTPLDSLIDFGKFLYKENFA
ncbi:TetR/AcrR family transcriptional regulator [Cellulophaga baltica]|uniref:TetR family transcriptional regulator C-terminal domain-containing protein n=1 Tax=Cellulophaga TaxID=104264 RepID=UPI001C0763C9|nr:MULTISPECIES: TetR family transcriptional regulator C-terminal domain-containing protein [Cellulophaga]MBU2998059.1 TetR/AcrR family transcriptional regulator [Cellulophaga baltica]MDO6769461.1 TetR family transcriptional regulator C-terminal domain-containing protein [Cellulophaga sp. 1_MG-2023]